MSYFKLNWCNLAGLLGLSVFAFVSGHPAFAGTKSRISHDIATTQGPALQFNGMAPNWMARVATKEGNAPLINVCTGVFLSPEYFITAKHCIPPDPVVMNVALGKGGSSDGPQDDDHFLPAVSVGDWGDVALLQVNGEITGAGMVPLMHGFDFYRNEKGTILGYGATSYELPKNSNDKNTEQRLHIGSVLTGMESDLLPAMSGNKGISVHYAGAISRWGDSGGPLMLNPPVPEMLFHQEDNDEMLPHSVIVSQEKVPGILFGGANNDVTYSELTPEILSKIAAISKISIFESPGDGHILVHDENGFVIFRGWGPKPWGVSISLLVSPDVYEDPHPACMKDDMQQDINDKNKWFCYFDIKKLIPHHYEPETEHDGNIIYEAKIIPEAPDRDGSGKYKLDKCADDVQKSDCVKFYYNTGELAIDYKVFSSHDFLGTGPLINIGSDGFYYIPISGVPGSNINIETKSLSKYVDGIWQKMPNIIETQHCYDNNNIVLNSVSVNPNGHYTCKLKLTETPDNRDVNSIVRQQLSVWYADAAVDDTGKPVGIKTNRMNFRRVVDPNVNMVITPYMVDQNTRKNIVMSPFDISGADNITTGNGYLDETSKTIEIKTDNGGVSGFSEFNNAPILHSGTWGQPHYSFFSMHTLKDGDEFNTNAYLFINGSNMPSASTSGNGFKYVYRKPGLKINNPKNNFVYTAGQTINFNGTLEFKHPGGTLNCLIYYATPEDRAGQLLEKEDATVSNKNWSCPPIDTQKYYDNVKNFQDAFDKYKSLELAARIIHTVGEEETEEQRVFFTIKPFAIVAPASGTNSSTTRSATTDWVAIAPEYLVKGIGEPGASVNVPIPASSDCNTTVADDATWSCGLQETPADGEYTLNATQITSDGRVAKANSSFIVKQKDEDEELEEGGNGGDGNGGGINGNTGGGEAGTGTGNAPYLIFPATAADGALMSAAATTTAAAGLTTVAGAAGAAGGAVATVGITITLGGTVITDKELTPDWGKHGLWRYDISKIISGQDPLNSFILSVINYDIHHKPIGKRVIPLSKQITIESPAESQIIPYYQPYTIAGHASSNTPVTVTIPGRSEPVCSVKSAGDGRWNCLPPEGLVGPATIIATQKLPEGATGGTPLTVERHYTVSVRHLTIQTPQDKSTIIHTPYNVGGQGQSGTSVKVTIQKSGQVAVEGTTVVNESGAWSYPISASESVPDSYTATAVTIVDGKELQDKQTVTWTVSGLVDNSPTIESPTKGEIVTQNTYRIQGKGKPGHRIDVRGIPVVGECHTVVTDTGEWSCYPIRVAANADACISMNDRDDNSDVFRDVAEKTDVCDDDSGKLRGYTLEPSFTVDSPKEDETLGSTFTITGHAPAGSPVKVVGMNTAADCNVTATEGGGWTCPGNGTSYPDRDGIYRIIASGTDSAGKHVAIMREFAVTSGVSEAVHIDWPTENMNVNANDFYISGRTASPTGAVSVKLVSGEQSPAEELCKAHVEKDGNRKGGFWTCKAHKGNGSGYVIRAFLTVNGRDEVSESTSFSVSPEWVSSLTMSIDSPVEGEIIRTQEYLVKGVIRGGYYHTVGYSVVPDVCSGSPMQIDQSNSTWSCTAHAVPGKVRSVTITAREDDGANNHDDSAKRTYVEDVEAITSPRKADVRSKKIQGSIVHK